MVMTMFVTIMVKACLYVGPETVKRHDGIYHCFELHVDVHPMMMMFITIFAGD